MLLSLLISCSHNYGDRYNISPSIRLTVSAAISLQEAMEAIKLVYQQANPQVEIIYNFASSGSLQRQIEQGAPVDIFISAATNKMDALHKQNLLYPETRQDLFKNQMVLIVPLGNNQISNFSDLTKDTVKTIAIGEPSSVPAGAYAQELLTSLGIANQVNAKAVYGKDVRQVLNYVATGNAEAGIVYYTDAQTSDRLKIVATAPTTIHAPIVYPIAVIQGSTNPEAAQDLVNFLTTPPAQNLFTQYGFIDNLRTNHN